MALRERKDCTEEGLVPRAEAIQSSERPSSTQRRMSSVNFLSETLWFIPTRHTAFKIAVFGSRPTGETSRRRCVPSYSRSHHVRHILDAGQGRRICQTTYLSGISPGNGVLVSRG